VTFAAALTGGPLGGKVNTIAPSFEYKHFRPLFAGRESRARLEAGKPTRTLGVRFLLLTLVHSAPRSNRNSLSFVGGTPLFSRFFLGGEQDIRGYNIRSISPSAPVRPASPAKRPRDGLLDGKSSR